MKLYEGRLLIGAGLLFLGAAAQPPKKIMDWLVTEAIEPSEHGRQVIATTTAEDGRAGLGLRCISGHGSFVLNEPSGTYRKGEAVTLTIRPNSGSPAEFDGIAVAATGVVAEAGPALADTLADGGSLGLRARSGQGIQKTYHFTSRGAKAALAAVIKACGWE